MDLAGFIPAASSNIYEYLSSANKFCGPGGFRTHGLFSAIDSPFVALYHLAVKTGMRMGELLGLMWPDLQWGSGRLYVQRQLQDVRGMGSFFQEPKTSSGRRTLQLGQGITDHLRAQLQLCDLTQKFARDKWQENDLVFPSDVGAPIGGDRITHEFRILARMAGLPVIRLHDCRHFAATLILSHSIPHVETQHAASL